MSKQLTTADLSSVVFFKRHRDDFSRWVDWDEKKKQVFELFPHLLQAIQAEYAATLLMEAALAEIENAIDEEQP